MNLQESRKGLIQSSTAVCCDSAIRINGRVLKANKHRAYFDIQLVPAFPQINAYRSAFTARTLENSKEYLEGQCFNLEHTMASNSAITGREIREDRVLGTVMEVEFPQGQHRLTSEPDAPFLRAVCSATKRAKGMDRVLGQQASGRHAWMGSIEFNLDLAESGVALMPGTDEERGSKMEDRKADPSSLLHSPSSSIAALLAEHTPRDWAERGYGYLPLAVAPAELLACFDTQAYGGYGGFTRPFLGRPLALIVNGLDGQVEFFGAGLVEYGAFRTAFVQGVAAEDAPALTALAELGRGMEAALGRLGEDRS